MERMEYAVPQKVNGPVHTGPRTNASNIPGRFETRLPEVSDPSLQYNEGLTVTCRARTKTRMANNGPKAVCVRKSTGGPANIRDRKRRILERVREEVRLENARLANPPAITLRKCEFRSDPNHWSNR